MAIQQRLELKTGQTLAMTPQLQQALKLLQMSNLELQAFVDAEMEKNPLLQTQEERDTDSDAPSLTDSSEQDRQRESPEAGTSESPPEIADLGGYDAFATSSFANVGKGGSVSFENDRDDFESTLTLETDLRSHIMGQINMQFHAAADRAIAIVLLEALDDSGYIRADLKGLAERLGCPLERVQNILGVLQKCEPAGLFARDLRECLALQLRDRGRLDPAMDILLDHLDLLAARDLKKLKTLCGVDEDDLRDMISEIKALSPKPALAFDHFVAQTVIPDVFMKPLPKSQGGGFRVELNQDTLPKVLLNQRYCTEVGRSAKEKKDKAYLSERLQAANWLVRTLDQRAQTILKVAGEIITQQEAFFLYGIEFLKPLVLKDIAQAISMHESTVSRVTTGKYIGTPRGVFELKYFFSSGVSSADGRVEISSSAIKSRIRALTETEMPNAILSDDDIANLLTKEGIPVARRTVTKYREALKIPSSVERRRLKKDK